MEKPNILFILGTGHCGSTLLDLLLGSHSKMFGAGEIERFETTSNCTCGAPPEQCEFWSELYQESLLRSLSLYRNPQNFLMGTDRFLTKRNQTGWKPLANKKRFIEDNLLLYRKIHDKCGKQMIVDSSKNIDRAELLARSNRIDARFIHIARDGRAVTWSYMKKYNKAIFYAYSCLTYHIKMAVLKKRTPARILRVEYEDLTKEPVLELKRILSFIGYDFEPGMINFRSENNHQMGGNDMRFNQSAEIREDRDWIRRMPKKYKLLLKFFTLLKKTRYTDKIR